MAAAAVQDGLLTLDERASDTLTEWREDPQWAAITIRQLLTMTGGQASTDGSPLCYLVSARAPMTAAPGAKSQQGPAPKPISGATMPRKHPAPHTTHNHRPTTHHLPTTPLT